MPFDRTTDEPGRPAPWAGRRPAPRALAAAALALAVAAGGLGWIAPAAVALAAALGAGAAAVAVWAAWAATAGAGEPVADVVRAAVEDDGQARLITGPGGDVVHANATFHRLFQASDTLDAIAARVDDDEGRAKFERLRAGAVAGAPERAEVRVRVRPGAAEWRRIDVVPIAGRPGYAAWTAADVTVLREAAAARRRADEALADWLDRLPAGFFSADAEGRVLYANRTLAEWLGVAADDLKGAAFAEYVVEGRAAPEGAADGSGLHGDVRLADADGETFRACLLQSERADEAGATLYSRSLVVRGVAWRAGAADDADAADRLRWLFAEAPVGIAVLDLSGAVVDCNAAFVRALGMRREGLVGRPFVERVAKEDREDVAGQLSKVLMGTTRAAHLEDVRVPRAGDRDLAASLYASRLEDADGDVTGLIVHFLDITEHRALEVQFAQSQKMQAVGQLAGGIAHDFNNLLTAMLGFCDLLLTRHGSDDPSFADIMQIRQNATRASNLVRQLLAFSRKQTMQPVVLDVRAALDDLSRMLERLLGETVALAIEHADDVGPVRVDPGQLDQVIINLAVNARDAMPGGGQLTLRTARALVDEPVHRGPETMPPGAYVRIEVADTGVGIAREIIGNIFEPFFSTKEKGAGTGLGLSTVYGIVRQTGGFVFVDSAPGEGSTFSIYLPEIAAAERPAPAPEPHVAAREPDLAGAGTVLLVEDEDAVRSFAARALRANGYRVLEAADGEAALDVLNEGDGAVDLIVSDVVMPGMDGLTFVKLVRHELGPIKVILMSGYAEEARPDDLDQDAGIHFLPKPFTLAELAGKVKDVLAE